jgi:hypothetical protein
MTLTSAVHPSFVDLDGRLRHHVQHVVELDRQIERVVADVGTTG